MAKTTEKIQLLQHNRNASSLHCTQVHIPGPCVRPVSSSSRNDSLNSHEMTAEFITPAGISTSSSANSTTHAMQPPPKKKPCITTKSPPPPPPPILRREIPTGTASPHTQAAEQAASATPPFPPAACLRPPQRPPQNFNARWALALPYPPTPTTQIRDFFAQRRLVVCRPTFVASLNQTILPKFPGRHSRFYTPPSRPNRPLADPIRS